jgi:hypothetical protein
VLKTNVHCCESEYGFKFENDLNHHGSESEYGYEISYLRSVSEIRVCMAMNLRSEI